MKIETILLGGLVAWYFIKKSKTPGVPNSGSQTAATMTSPSQTQDIMSGRITPYIGQQVPDGMSVMTGWDGVDYIVPEGTFF